MAPKVALFLALGAWLRTLLLQPSCPDPAASVTQPGWALRHAQAQRVRQRAGPHQGRLAPAPAMLPAA